VVYARKKGIYRIYSPLYAGKKGIYRIYSPLFCRYPSRRITEIKQNEIFYSYYPYAYFRK